MGAASAREFSSRATTPATPAGDAARSPRARGRPPRASCARAAEHGAVYEPEAEGRGLLLSGAGQVAPAGRPPTASGGRNGARTRAGSGAEPAAPPAAGAAPAPAEGPALDREARTKMIVRGLYNKM